MKDAEIKENIFIPKKLKCGFNLKYVKDDSYVKRYIRIDGEYVKVEETTEPTYKIGFVSYYDEKGKFRHETSFNNWISEKVPTEEHENVPTKGFKFFKQANRFSYNRFCSYRNVSFQIQDPRGWVFEITQNNLAWIIDNCSIIKGDIEGEFVYGWDGKDRVLIPCSSETFKDNIAYSNILNSQGYITPKNLQMWHVYKSKQGEKMMFVGRHDVYSRSSWVKNRYSWNGEEETKKKEGYIKDSEGRWRICKKKSKQYLFAILNDDGTYYTAYLHSFSNPKDKFIEDCFEEKNEEVKKAVEHTLATDVRYYETYYAEEKKYYLTHDDIITYVLNAMKYKNVDSITCYFKSDNSWAEVMGVKDEAYHLKKMNEQHRGIELYVEKAENGKFIFRKQVKKKNCRLFNDTISEKEYTRINDFIEYHKPYLLYFETSKGTKAFKSEAVRNYLQNDYRVIWDM